MRTAGTTHLLLGGDGSPAELAARLGIPAHGWFTVAAYATPPAGGPIARAAELIELHLRTRYDDVAIVGLDATVYALMVDREQPERARMRSAVGDCVARMRRMLGDGARAGLGTTVTRVGDVADARASADRALAVGAELRTHGLVDVEDVRAESFVLALREFAERAPHPLSRQLAQLFAHDEANATGYVPTLRAYLDCMGDCARVARRLFIHPNTVRYRMRRIVELTDLDLASADQRFALECQLRLLT